jgi:hypothetical protein
LAYILVPLLLNCTVESIYPLNGLNDNRFVWLADANSITGTASGDQDRVQYGKPPLKERTELHEASLAQEWWTHSVDVMWHYRTSITPGGPAAPRAYQLMNAAEVVENLSQM